MAIKMSYSWDVIIAPMNSLWYYWHTGVPQGDLLNVVIFHNFLTQLLTPYIFIYEYLYKMGMNKKIKWVFQSGSLHGSSDHKQA